MAKRSFRCGKNLLFAAFLGALALAAWDGGATARAAHRTAPSQLRLSWSEDPKTSTTVVWQTASPTASSVVEFGTTERLGQRATGRRVTYRYETGVLHEATMRGLSPGTAYYYRAGDPEGGFSAVHRFRTAPAAPEEFTFTAFGDHGTSENSRRNVEHVVREAPAFHLILGDLSYANGNQPVWDQWFDLIEPMTRSIPLMTALGNHENERMGEERIGYVAYLARLAMPAPETWYTFDYAGARFISFNSDDHANPKQLEWLDNALAAARREARWVILFMHHPLYSSNVRRLNNEPLIKTLRERLDRHQVDLVLAGHNHNYERDDPLRGETIKNPDKARYRKGEGAVFVISGGGGKSLYEFVPEEPAITAYRESVPHYLRVRVPARGPLQVEAVRTADREVMDRFAIEEER